MKLDLSLIKSVSETPGVSGFEKPIRELIINNISNFVDKIDIDNMGNIIAQKKGKNSKKVLIAAHMDEIGFIVSHIDDKGFIRFHPLGGFDPKTLTSQRVIIHGKKDLIGVIGSKPIHLMSDDEKNKPVKITDFFIDLGLPAAEVNNLVEIGNPITRERELIEMGDCINGKSLDNRISVYVLIETLKLLKDKQLPYDLIAAFTVQEEVGTRGIQAIMLNVQPDFGIAIDTTIAFDVPSSTPQEVVTKLGEGVAIKIMDAAVICDYRMVDYLKNICNTNEIKWQPELLPKGGTDSGYMQRLVKNAAIVGAISLPTRHIHQVIETIHKSDIIESIKLLEKAILEMGNHNWSF